MQIVRLPPGKMMGYLFMVDDKGREFIFPEKSRSYRWDLIYLMPSMCANYCKISTVAENISSC